MAIAAFALTAPATAQDAAPGSGGFFGEAMRDVFDHIWVPRTTYTNSPHVRSAFRTVVADVRSATVEIRSRGRRIARGGIVGPDGWVITKASLVSGPVTVRLKDGRELDARLVGVESATDLAMLKIDAKELPTLDLGGAEEPPEEFVAIRADSEADAEEETAIPTLGEPRPLPGDWLATVGLGRDPVAVGVVSVLPRTIEKRPGFLGIVMDVEYTPAAGAIRAVRIKAVANDSAAQEAGMEDGDLIVAVDSKPTPDAASLKTIIGSRNPGDRVELEVLRGDEKLRLFAMLRGWQPNAAERRAYYQNSLGGELSERRFGFPSALQHDTVIDADDCGGPIVDLDGRVVGFNISRAGRTETYALPVSLVRSRLLDLMSGRLAPVGG